MATVAEFLKNNQMIAQRYECAVYRFVDLVGRYDQDKWRSLYFSSHALADTLSLEEDLQAPLLIEALCNLEPKILERQYFYIDMGECEQVEEVEICQALVDNYFPSPITGERDYSFKDKISLRYVLSDKVLNHGL